MIISEKSSKDKEIIKILDNLSYAMDENSKIEQDRYLNIGPNEMEEKVLKKLNQISKGTIYYDSFRRVNSQEFPDLVSETTKCGIEVKQTKGDKWITTGNSIMEGSRVDGIDNIYLFFAKLSSPIVHKWRKYEDCLADVLVTHSPRYKIDMDITEDQTIFNKIGITYDELRTSQNPFQPIRDYYKKENPSLEMWWIDKDETSQRYFHPYVRVWNTLDSKEKDKIKSEIFVFFPEILTNSNRKFGRVAAWAVARHGVVIPNIRDLFTSGGKKEISFDNKTFKIPKILYTLKKCMPNIQYEFKNLTAEEVKDYWDIEIGNSSLFDLWLNIIKNASYSILKDTKLDIIKFINE